MDKIVYVSRRSEPDEALLMMLETLFPDCEIQVVYKGNDGAETHYQHCFDNLLASESMGRA